MLLVLYSENLTAYNQLYNNFKQDNNVVIINEYLINKNIMILESLSPTQTLHDLCEYLKKQKH